MTDKHSTDFVTQAMRRWVDDVVIGHNLCPFARAIQTRLRIAVSPAQTLIDILRDAESELEHLINASPEVLPTSILAIPNALDNFEDYLEALELLEMGLENAQLAGEIQIASFHPHYVFDGLTYDDVANATNRSPFPAFHFLREDDVEDARRHHPDTELIPQRNIDYFKAMGIDAVTKLLKDCVHGEPTG